MLKKKNKQIEEEKEEKEEEEKEEEEEKKEEEKEEEEKKDDDEKLDEEVKSLTSKIEKSLGLDKIKTMLESHAKRDATLMTKIFGKEDVTKDDVNALTKEQKIVGFFRALCEKDRVALKALSEGTAADGGYAYAKCSP